MSSPNQQNTDNDDQIINDADNSTETNIINPSNTGIMDIADIDISGIVNEINHALGSNEIVNEINYEMNSHEIINNDSNPNPNPNPNPNHNPGDINDGYEGARVLRPYTGVHREEEEVEAPEPEVQIQSLENNALFRAGLENFMRQQSIDDNSVIIDIPGFNIPPNPNYNPLNSQDDTISVQDSDDSDDELPDLVENFDSAPIYNNSGLIISQRDEFIERHAIQIRPSQRGDFNIENEERLFNQMGEGYDINPDPDYDENGIYGYGRGQLPPQ